MKSESVKALIDNFGKLYSEILGINLRSDDEEIFKWFLASLLFGAPITEGAVIKTFNCFKKHEVLTPEKILETGWDGLVKILDEGNYTRYDFKTADKLLEVIRNLMEKYDGSLITLYNSASDEQNLENKLKNLGKGIGEVTVSIFLRELREAWKRSDPKPTSLVIFAAKKLGIVKDRTGEDASMQLKTFWFENEIAGKSFVNFETALLRLGKDYCRKKKCTFCVVKGACLVPAVP